MIWDKWDILFWHCHHCHQFYRATQQPYSRTHMHNRSCQSLTLHQNQQETPFISTLAAHLEMINKMMSLFPGANCEPPMQPVDIKNLFYQMMPGDWQRAFLNSNQVITDDKYTLLSLQCFMTLQEEQTSVDATCHCLHSNRQAPH